MEPDIEPTEDQIKQEPILQLFKYKHLARPDLRACSRSFTAQALFIFEHVPKNPERTVALRELRRAKDSAVTAILWVM